MKRNLLKSLIVSALLATTSLASVFNRNVTAPKVLAYDPARPRRSKDKRRHIKGMKSSNFSRYGRGLQNQFDSNRRARFPFSAKKVAA